MRLFALSDLHLDSAEFQMPKGLDFDVIVVAGDLCDSGQHGVNYLADFDFNHGKPVIYVIGNHEYYNYPMPVTLSAMRQQAESTLVHILDRDELILGGIRFMGCTLWTDWQLPIRGRSDADKAMAEASLYMLDYRRISPSENDLELLKPQNTVAFHERDKSWLLDELAKPFDGQTVVITHHAPHRLSLARQYAMSWASPAFVSDLPKSAFSKAQLWIHGHTHTSFDYHVEGCRVICNPRGYKHGRTGDMEVETLSSALVVEIG